MSPKQHAAMVTLGISNYSLVLVGLIVATSALLILIKNPKSDLHRSFFIFAIGGAAWVSGIGLLSLTKNFSFDQMINFGGVIFIVGFFLLALSIPVKMRFSVNPLLVLTPVAIDMIYIIPSGLVNRGMVIGKGGVLIPVPGPFIWPHALLGLCYTAFGIIILAYKFKHSNGKERLRIKYLFLATGLFASISVICDAILPALGISSVNLLGPLSSIPFIAITAYAIVRHELMDIRIVIQRGVIYTLLLALIAAVYLSIVNFLGIIVGTDSGIAIVITGMVTTAAGIFTFPLLEKVFRKLTDRFFFRDRYNYADALHELSEIVYTTIEFDLLVERIESALLTIFKCDSVKLDIDPQKHKLFDSEMKASSHMPTARVPIALGQDEIGSIFCGRKRSGEDYMPHDIQLLETFAYQAATALSRAKFYLEVKSQAITLESKVDARTKDLQRAQEHQKQMMLDISHNLQTPLAIFQTKIEQLKQSYRFDPAVANFEQSLRDLSSFIYSLLTLAKLENRPEPPSIAEVNVSDLVDDIAEEMSIITENAGIELNVKINPDVKVLGSTRELREAILNIASNAVKYMREAKKRTIAIRLEKKETSTLLSVADNGIGIAETDAARLFERFYRVKKTKNSTGTGLGLAITKKIVDYHGGRIWCESKEGVGTTFFIELPLVGADRTYWQK